MISNYKYRFNIKKMTQPSCHASTPLSVTTTKKNTQLNCHPERSRRVTTIEQQ